MPRMLPRYERAEGKLVLRTRTWTPRHDRLLRHMWRDPWEYSIEQIAEACARSADVHEVRRRASELGLGPRPERKLIKDGTWASWGEFMRDWRRRRDCRLRRLRLRQVLEARGLLRPSVRFLDSGRREVVPEVRAEIEAFLAARKKCRE